MDAGLYALRGRLGHHRGRAGPDPDRLHVHAPCRRAVAPPRAVALRAALLAGVHEACARERAEDGGRRRALPTRVKILERAHRLPLGTGRRRWGTTPLRQNED